MFTVLHVHCARKLGEGSACRCGRGPCGLQLNLTSEARALPSREGPVPGGPPLSFSGAGDQQGFCQTRATAAGKSAYFVQEVWTESLTDCYSDTSSKNGREV